MRQSPPSLNKFLSAIGLILQAVYYVLIAVYLYNFFNYADTPLYDYGSWVWAVIIAVPVVLAYVCEGILSFARRRSVFNIIKLILAVALVPLFWFCGEASGVARFVVWNAFFLAAFVVEIISLFKTPAPKSDDAVRQEVSQNYLTDFQAEKREV